MKIKDKKMSFILAELLLVSVGFTDVFDDATNAHNKGNNKKTFTIFKNLASNGDVTAQCNTA